jgi:hypothetical protein
MEPIEDNNTDTVQCQLYNDWTRDGTGTNNDCRFIVQSPTGVAYVLTFPVFDRYKDTHPDVYSSFYKMLEYHLLTTNHRYTDTWIAPVSYEHMCLIRDYGMPIHMPKLDWMVTYDGLQEEIESVRATNRKKLPTPKKSSEVGAWLDEMLDNQSEEEDHDRFDYIL